MQHIVPLPVSYGLLFAGAGILIAAAMHDCAVRTVPNWMAAALAVLGIAARGIDGSLPCALLAGLIVFSTAAFCWRRGWLGGADVKLLGAAALIVPPASVYNLIMAVALTGGALALSYLGLRRLVPVPRPIRPATLVARIARVESWRIRRGGPLPYACAIAVGAVIILSRGSWP
jgi:prepilin peptidase CpaA